MLYLEHRHTHLYADLFGLSGTRYDAAITIGWHDNRSFDEFRIKDSLTREVPPDANKNPKFDFKRCGVRIPTLLISPWVTPGTIFRAGYYPEVRDSKMLPFDHTSVLATLCKWKGIPYQDKAHYPNYYLGDRTASAPTFENVITNVNNKVFPTLTPHRCSVGMTGIVKRRELIRAVAKNIAGITGLTQAEVVEQGMVEEVFNNCQTAEELKDYLDTLAKKYGTSGGGGEDVGGGS